MRPKTGSCPSTTPSRLRRKNLQELVKPEDAKHPGTRPADLKRYLKPLLKQRSDLVLIGRLLIIRPVRHIVRGVFFDRTSDKYQFKLWLILRLLLEPGNCRVFAGRVDIGQCRVWDPEFPALLFHVLEQDVFSELATFESLADVDVIRSAANRRSQGSGPWLRLLFSPVAASVPGAHRHQRGVPAAIRNVANWLSPAGGAFGAGYCISLRRLRSGRPKSPRYLQLGDAWEPSRRLPSRCPRRNERGRPTNRCFRPSRGLHAPGRTGSAPPTQPGEVHYASRHLRRRGA